MPHVFDRHKHRKIWPFQFRINNTIPRNLVDWTRSITFLFIFTGGKLYTMDIFWYTIWWVLSTLSFSMFAAIHLFTFICFWHCLLYRLTKVQFVTTKDVSSSTKLKWTLLNTLTISLTWIEYDKRLWTEPYGTPCLIVTIRRIHYIA